VLGEDRDVVLFAEQFAELVGAGGELAQVAVAVRA
jgi:hypothetical protein